MYEKKAAEKYADGVFGSMMWMKTFAVFLGLEAGVDVLFQDVDLVWLQNPVRVRVKRYEPDLTHASFVYFVLIDERATDDERAMEHTVDG